jgi:hypothetical protein
VFTTTGNTPVSGFGKAKARIDAHINALLKADGLDEIDERTLHDLRRTLVTVMNEKLGILPHVVEAVVNHMSGLAKAGSRASTIARSILMRDGEHSTPGQHT